jgi:hypothetical protein
VVDLLLMHVAGADRPKEALAAFLPDREHDEDMASARVPADGIEARFGILRIAVGQDSGRAGKDSLDRRSRYTMLAAFRPVARIPVEAGETQVHPQSVGKRLYMSISKPPS